MIKYLSYSIGIVILIYVYNYQYKKYTFNYKQVIKYANSLNGNRDEVLKPKLGFKVLPFESQVLLYAIDTLKIPNYRTHGNFSRYGNKNMAWFYFNGSAWPSHLDTTSKHIVGLTNELITIPGIKIIFNYENVGVGVID